ncbi:MAG: hypothetical protein FWG70_00180 [Oscillospiraceae bacterium]|nr:hypothetical protein [Oscillospiraceae bacterium]
MVEHGLYILRPEFFELIKSLGGDCDSNAGGKRPVYCCIKDNKIDGLYWAIPTTNISHRSEAQNKKFSYFMSLDDKDLRSCYYHKANTTVKSIYKISSCFPVIEKYVDHEFTTSGVHVIMRRKNDISEIERKLKRILSFEFRKNNYFPQRISDIRNNLIAEIDAACQPKSFEVENPVFSDEALSTVEV